MDTQTLSVVSPCHPSALKLKAGPKELKAETFQRDITTQRKSTSYLMLILLDHKQVPGVYGADCEFPASLSTYHRSLIENNDHTPPAIYIDSSSYQGTIPCAVELRRLLSETNGAHTLKTNNSIQLNVVYDSMSQF